MDFFEALLMIALFAGLCVLGVWYANYATDKERRQYEEAERAEREKRDYESKVRREYLQKENALREKELQLQKEKDQIERNKRFVYDHSVHPPRVFFVKNNLNDYLESIPATYLSYFVEITQIYHASLLELEIATRDVFPDFNVSPHYSVNCASFLLNVSQEIAWKYDGSSHELSDSIYRALKKLFVLCGFDNNLDATNLKSNYSLFEDVNSFYSTFLLIHDEITPLRKWEYSYSIDPHCENEKLEDFYNYFLDIIFIPIFFISDSYRDIYSQIDDSFDVPPLSPAQHLFLIGFRELISDFHKNLSNGFEKFFSEETRQEFDAIDNDDLVWTYGYNKFDYAIHDFFYPFSN